jgi:hypothetical protein
MRRSVFRFTQELVFGFLPLGQSFQREAVVLRRLEGRVPLSTTKQETFTDSDGAKVTLVPLGDGFVQCTREIPEPRESRHSTIIALVVPKEVPVSEIVAYLEQSFVIPSRTSANRLELDAQSPWPMRSIGSFELSGALRAARASLARGHRFVIVAARGSRAEADSLRLDQLCHVYPHYFDARLIEVRQMQDPSQAATGAVSSLSRDLLSMIRLDHAEIGEEDSRQRRRHAVMVIPLTTLSDAICGLSADVAPDGVRRRLYEAMFSAINVVEPLVSLPTILRRCMLSVVIPFLRSHEGQRELCPGPICVVRLCEVLGWSVLSARFGSIDQILLPSHFYWFDSRFFLPIDPSFVNEVVRPSALMQSASPMMISDIPFFKGNPECNAAEAQLRDYMDAVSRQAGARFLLSGSVVRWL